MEIMCYDTLFDTHFNVDNVHDAHIEKCVDFKRKMA